VVGGSPTYFVLVVVLGNTDAEVVQVVNASELTTDTPLYFVSVVRRDIAPTFVDVPRAVGNEDTSSSEELDWDGMTGGVDTTVEVADRGGAATDEEPTPTGACVNEELAGMGMIVTREITVV
jgi:hypothetical protein